MFCQCLSALLSCESLFCKFNYFLQAFFSLHLQEHHLYTFLQPGFPVFHCKNTCKPYRICNIPSCSRVSWWSSSVSVQKPVIISVDDPAIRHYLTYPVHFSYVPFSGISAVHQLQNPGASTLYRQMNIFADIFVFRHGKQHFIGNIFWMRSMKTYPKQRVRSVQLFRASLAKVTVTYHPLCSVYPIITVYILSQ